ncbi:hypothetical protein N0V93_004005 [Gnomoniopsis smithogilvyi]|uniref:Carboxylic ester hydrolase n=1 Tax=Gnomoniopsis smithogilvyi TaxID=1191159 RepID=A0A9W8YXQ1_9PEZI|nr:hypothetical protein N0V93_004005 [Gnomoniopsis smithogilvyi]
MVKLLFLSLHSAIVLAQAMTQCERLVSSISGYGIINSTHVAADRLSIGGVANTIPFCRVFASLPYALNNSLVYEVWLPDAAQYNGRYLSVGNGGFAGVIDEDALIENLNLGFAVAGGDGGHRAVDNNDGNGAPGIYLPFLHDINQTLAWIHKSIAYFTPLAQDLVQEYYSQAPSFSYYKGCSTGGAQGFALAQFYPDLFDGIIAGSPGNWYSHLSLSFLWGYHVNQTLTAQGSAISQDDLNLISDAVVLQCDELDGVKDGLIENPLMCDFDIATLSCSPSQNSSTCLNPAQVNAVRAIYAGPHDSRTNASLYPGMGISSEIGWISQLGELAQAFSIPILQNLVFKNLSYDAYTFDWGSDVHQVDEHSGVLIDEISTNLSDFQAHGGKLIVTQGWSDPLNAATWPLDHLQQIQHHFGVDVSDWFNVFMVPGGGHCGQGYYPQAPTKYYSLAKLVQWVEQGVPPNEMLSSDPADGTNTTRKLCPWPKTSQYVGGDINDWTSYICQ